MTDDQITQRRQVKRKYLLVVIKCLRYLACPWILLQGFDNNDYLTQILYLLKTKYDNITKHLQGQVGHKNIIHEIQNKLLHIMASNVLRVVFSTICKQKLFSTMAKKGTGISNIESLMFYVRSVNDDLDVSKNSIGFYGFGNIKSEIIVNAIKAILVRWHLDLDDFRGQTYDGVRNLVGKRLGVSTQILAEWLKAMTTHFRG